MYQTTWNVTPSSTGGRPREVRRRQPPAAGPEPQDHTGESASSSEEKTGRSSPTSTRRTHDAARNRLPHAPVPLGGLSSSAVLRLKTRGNTSAAAPTPKITARLQLLLSKSGIGKPKFHADSGREHDAKHTQFGTHEDTAVLQPSVKCLNQLLPHPAEASGRKPRGHLNATPRGSASSRRHKALERGHRGCVGGAGRRVLRSG